MNPDIQIINFQQIDSRKWNQCVLGASQGTVFGVHEYLSGMTPDWHGLVVGDYEAVLPLLTRAKWGIRYLAVLPFVRQLGLMGSYRGAAEALLVKIQGFCQYGDIGFNHDNGWLFEAEKGQARWSRPNYVIDLRPGYEVIWQGYRKSLTKRLSQASSAGLRLVSGSKAGAAAESIGTVPVIDVLSAYQDFIRSKMLPGTYNLDKDFALLKQLLNTDFGRQYFHPYAVKDGSGDLLLLGIYARDNRRIYKMMTVCMGKGREKNAMGFAVDALIQQFAGQPLFFDFMGSSLPGVQEFIHGFGARLEPYFLYHYNQLPWPLKLIKK